MYFCSEQISSCNESSKSGRKGVSSHLAHADLASGPIKVTRSAHTSCNSGSFGTSSFLSLGILSLHADFISTLKTPDSFSSYRVFPDLLVVSWERNGNHAGSAFVIMLVCLKVDPVDKSNEEFDFVVRLPVAIIFPEQLSGSMDCDGVGVRSPFRFRRRSCRDFLAVLVTNPVVGHLRFFVEMVVPFDPIEVTERLLEFLSGAFAVTLSLHPEASVGFSMSFAYSLGFGDILDKDSSPVSHATDLLRGVDADA